MTNLAELQELIIKGKKKTIPELIQNALDDGCEASAVLNAMIDAMKEVGERFKKEELFVPEMLMAANAMKKGVDTLKPHLASDAVGAKGTVLLGTVAGDLHDIGKNLVGIMFESSGYNVVDLGVDVPVARYIEAYNENPDTKIIACSALLTTTMDNMEAEVKTLNEQEWRKNVKVLVGGAPIDAEFATKIGADAYADDAATAVDAAENLLA